MPAKSRPQTYRIHHSQVSASVCEDTRRTRLSQTRALPARRRIQSLAVIGPQHRTKARQERENLGYLEETPWPYVAVCQLQEIDHLRPCKCGELLTPVTEQKGNNPLLVACFVDKVDV